MAKKVDGLGQILIAADREQQLVKADVVAENGPQIAGLDTALVGARDLGQRRDQFGRSRQRNELRRLDLEHLAHGVELPNLRRRELADPGAAAARTDHDADPFELDQGLTDEMAFDAESLGQFLLDQPFTGEEAAEDDLLLQLLHNLADRIDELAGVETAGRHGISCPFSRPRDQVPGGAQPIFFRSASRAVDFCSSRLTIGGRTWAQAGSSLKWAMMRLSAGIIG